VDLEAAAQERQLRQRIVARRRDQPRRDFDARLDQLQLERRAVVALERRHHDAALGPGLEQRRAQRAIAQQRRARRRRRALGRDGAADAIAPGAERLDVAHARRHAVEADLVAARDLDGAELTAGQERLEVGVLDEERDAVVGQVAEAPRRRRAAKAHRRVVELVALGVGGARSAGEAARLGRQRVGARHERGVEPATDGVDERLGHAVGQHHQAQAEAHRQRGQLVTPRDDGQIERVAGGEPLQRRGVGGVVDGKVSQQRAAAGGDGDVVEPQRHAPERCALESRAPRRRQCNHAANSCTPRATALRRSHGLPPHSRYARELYKCGKSSQAVPFATGR